MGQKAEEWDIASAPKDGRKIEVKSKEAGIWHVAEWDPEGDSWVDENGVIGCENAHHLEITGVWDSEGGWFQPDEVTHWREPMTIPERDPRLDEILASIWSQVDVLNPDESLEAAIYAEVSSLFSQIDTRTETVKMLQEQEYLHRDMMAQAKEQLEAAKGRVEELEEKYRDDPLRSVGIGSL